jgi:hypothetical protein|tara:strand:- start:421 stop:840 length:420 start_codon:yes stop_codon:yes gene_type:complete
MARASYLEQNSGSFLEGIAVKANHVEYHSSAVTLDNAADVGGVHIVDNADIVVTLPAVATGLEYKIVLGIDLGSSEYLRLDPNASDKFLGGCGQAASTDGKYIGCTGAKKGAVISVKYGTADGWYIKEMDDASSWTYES